MNQGSRGTLGVHSQGLWTPPRPLSPLNTTNAHPLLFILMPTRCPSERKAGWGALARHRAFQDGETPVLARWDPKTPLASALRAKGLPAGKGQEQPQPLVCQNSPSNQSRGIKTEEKPPWIHKEPPERVPVPTGNTRT